MRIYEDRIVLCGNKEDDDKEICASPVPDFTAIKVMLSVAKQR